MIITVLENSVLFHCLLELLHVLWLHLSERHSHCSITHTKKLYSLLDRYWIDLAEQCVAEVDGLELEIKTSLNISVKIFLNHIVYVLRDYIGCY